MCIVQASSHLTGLTRSVELAAIGRRVAETEHDLLELIAPESRRAPTPTVPHEEADGPHDAPTAAQLVEAVREYLESDWPRRPPAGCGSTAGWRPTCWPWWSGSWSGPAQAEAHRSVWRRWAWRRRPTSRPASGPASGPSTTVPAQEHMHATVVDKLAVANPKYL